LFTFVWWIIFHSINMNQIIFETSFGTNQLETSILFQFILSKLLNSTNSVGHKGRFGHEFLEFEFRPSGKLRYANNSHYKQEVMIRKEGIVINDTITTTIDVVCIIFTLSLI
jgi:hypothetical protein